jgi:hypothetical protein
MRLRTSDILDHLDLIPYPPDIVIGAPPLRRRRLLSYTEYRSVFCRAWLRKMIADRWAMIVSAAMLMR